MDEDGSFSEESCFAVCEAQQQLQTIDGCEVDLVSHAQRLESADTGASAVAWVLDCRGEQTMYCM